MSKESVRFHTSSDHLLKGTSIRTMNYKKTLICSLEDCDKAYYAKPAGDKAGYCRSHYDMVRRSGVPVYQSELSNNCTECGTEISFKKTRCTKCYMADWYYNHQGNSKGEWRKEVVGYSGAHSRLRAVRGHPKEYDCHLCENGKAEEWCLSADTPVEKLLFGRSNKTRNLSAYSTDPYDFFPAHHKCHVEYDTELGNRTYKTAQYARAGGSRWKAA